MQRFVLHGMMILHLFFVADMLRADAAEKEVEFPEGLTGIVSQTDAMAVVSSCCGDFGLCRKVDYVSEKTITVILVADREIEIPLPPVWCLSILASVVCGFAVAVGAIQHL